MTNGTTPGEVPIIIQGGNSVDVNVPKKFKEGGKEGGKFRADDRDLEYLTIDGKRHELNATSRVEVYYAARGGGKSGA